MIRTIYIDQWGKHPDNTMVHAPYGDNNPPAIYTNSRRFKVEIELPDWVDNWQTVENVAVIEVAKKS